MSGFWMEIVEGGLRTLPKNVRSDATDILERRSMWRRLEKDSGYMWVIRMKRRELPPS